MDSSNSFYYVCMKTAQVDFMSVYLDNTIFLLSSKINNTLPFQ